MNNRQPPGFHALVEQFYRPLYRFGLSLTGSEAEAGDLTQQTFLIWATKGHRLRDADKVKTWLFTTLHREFLKSLRRQRRFPHQQLEQSEHELPALDPATVSALDAQELIAALARVEEPYRVALALFYLEEMSYKEIAEILRVPIGTVQSRIARGRAQLQRLLMEKSAHD